MGQDNNGFDDGDGILNGDPGTELASNRTAMSFERTAMASDRTLMAVVRTSLSLIGFGFTIFQFFHSLNTEFLEGRLPSEPPRRFGATLVVLGIVLLALGIHNHLRETRARRQRRARLCERQLIRHLEPVRASSVMVIAILLLMVGVLAIVSIALRAGPY